MESTVTNSAITTACRKNAKDFQVILICSNLVIVVGERNIPSLLYIPKSCFNLKLFSVKYFIFVNLIHVHVVVF